MNKLAFLAVPLLFAVSLTATIAQSKYSGVYTGNTSFGTKFVIVTSKGGHALGLDSSSRYKESLDPAKSTVNSLGQLKATTRNGVIINATIDSDFNLKGTTKSDDETGRLSGKRTLD